MSYTQTIKPNPYVSCRPGWCLTYVQDIFGIKSKYGSATAAWNASQNKHRDSEFPADVAVPVWFTLKSNPNGHVALRMADGSVYSSSHPTSPKPVHHASLDALFSYYGKGVLGYLGWTEDVEDTLVIKQGGDIPMDQVTKIYEALDAINKRLDSLGKVYDDLNASNQDRDRLWAALNETNKIVDALTKEASNDDKLISSAYIALDGTNKRVDKLEGRK